MKYCDLHTHSCYSDGTCTPEQLLLQAEKLGLTALVLSDHNTVEGLPRFVAAGKKSSVEAIAGVEFSTEYKETELHILALYLRPEHYASVTELMEDFCRRKEQSNRDLVQALNEGGICLDYEQILALGEGYINRAHIAAQMTRQGYTASVKEAFQKYLSPEAGFYVPPKRLDAFEAIRLIKSMGCAAVLAHPFLNLTQQLLREFLPTAIACGLDAMETMYARYDSETTALACSMATEFGILESGGSDFHGENKPDIRLGVGKGDLRIPESFALALKKRTAMR